jgi:hypothetical protein
MKTNKNCVECGHRLYTPSQHKDNRCCMCRSLRSSSDVWFIRCKVCGELFTAHRKGAAACDKCRSPFLYQCAVFFSHCVVCGKPFTKKGKLHHINTCSPKCRRTSKHATFKQGYCEVAFAQCEICGKWFRSKTIGPFQRKTCSRKCLKKMERREHRKWRENHDPYSKGYCERCGIKFYDDPHKSRFPVCRFCLYTIKARDRIGREYGISDE